MSTQISIVTPYFNGSQFFGDTVQSLLAQTHEDWEWIIVDDGSEPEELKALEAWCQSNDRIHWQPREGGPKGANRCRNQGWEHASAEHILFLDSDDMLLPHCLEQRVAHCLRSTGPATEIPYFGTLAVKAGEDGRWLWDNPNHPAPWLASLWSQTPPCQSSGPLWTKTALEQAGGWSEDIQVWQDIDIHQRAHFQGLRFVEAKGLPPDILYRIHSESLSHRQFHSESKLNSRFRILSDALSHAQEHSVSDEERSALMRMVWSVFRNACQHRNWKMADDIIQLAKPLARPQLDFLNQWKRASQYRWIRLPLVLRRMTRQAALVFPKSDRQILSTPYP